MLFVCISDASCHGCTSFVLMYMIEIITIKSTQQIIKSIPFVSN